MLALLPLSRFVKPKSPILTCTQHTQHQTCMCNWGVGTAVIAMCLQAQVQM
jgi:hypothetical protein